MRDTAWNFLLHQKITIPIEPLEIIKDNKWFVASFSSDAGKFLRKHIPHLIPSNDALTFEFESSIYILFDNSLPIHRLRFALAHEIGHIIMQHRKRKIDNYEQEANMFASRLLMPMCWLYLHNIQSPAEIVKLCNVSFESASYRFARYQMLLRRNKFLISPLERKLLNKIKKYEKGKKL